MKPHETDLENFDDETLALQHWHFVGKLLQKLVATYNISGEDETYWDFLRTVYTEAMIHGIKHGREEKSSATARGSTK